MASCRDGKAGSFREASPCLVITFPAPLLVSNRVHGLYMTVHCIALLACVDPSASTLLFAERRDRSSKDDSIPTSSSDARSEWHTSAHFRI